MVRCHVCGTQNVESSQVCQRCRAALNASPPTIANPDGKPPRGDHATAAVATAAASRELSPAGGFAPGSVIAERYRVVLLLGRGGMGEVYGADDLKLGQRVALKFLPSEHGRSANWRDQFYAEVRMARQVSHPNVCRVYDVGESEGRLFLSMEFVDGEDLESLLRRIGRLPEDKAVEVAQQLCAGLAATHRSGVLHRDLKPSNVMIDGMGRARITDFGLAIAAGEASQGASPARTPGYLAPELLEGAGPLPIESADRRILMQGLYRVTIYCIALDWQIRTSLVLHMSQLDMPRDSDIRDETCMWPSKTKKLRR